MYICLLDLFGCYFGFCITLVDDCVTLICGLSCIVVLICLDDYCTLVCG